MTLRDLFQDPLVVKELSGSSRRWQTHAARMLYVGIIGLVVWNFSQMWKEQVRWLSLSDYATLGRELFHGFFGLQMVMVAVGAVTASSDMISREARAGTLGLLASTPLTPWRIVAGKWKAALAQTSTLILCGAPILAVCAFLGGATAWDLTYCLCLTAATAILSAALALFFSALFRSGVTTMLVTLTVLAAYTLLPPLLFGKSDRFFGATILSFFHPAFAAIVTCSPGMIRSPELHFAWISACVVCVVMSLILLRAAAHRVKLLTVRSPAPPVLTRTFESMDRFYEGMGPEKIRKIRIFGDGNAVWQNRALLWKELRTRASGKLRNSVRISLVLLILMASAFWFGLDILYSLVWASGIGFVFLALSNGVGLFVKEKEERKWDVLLSTPLTSFEIVQTKLVAGLVPLVPALILLLLFWACTGWLCRLPLLMVLIMLAATLLPGLLAYMVGATASLHAASLRGAFTLAFSGMTGLLVLVPFLINLMAPHGLGWEASRFLSGSISPIPYLESVGRQMRWYGSWSEYRGDLDLEAFLLFLLVYGGAIFGLFLHLHAGFNRVTGRVRQ